jgi:hypothetical protein
VSRLKTVKIHWNLFSKKEPKIPLNLFLFYPIKISLQNRTKKKREKSSFNLPDHRRVDLLFQMLHPLQQLLHLPLTNILMLRQNVAPISLLPSKLRDTPRDLASKLHIHVMVLNVAMQMRTLEILELAVRTLIVALASVRFGVVVQIAAEEEFFVALIAGEFRFFVDAHFVVAELATQVELFAADVACETWLATVHGFVFRQLFAAVEFWGKFREN